MREYTLHWSEGRRRCARHFPSVTSALQFVHERDLARRGARIEDSDERVVVSEAHMLAAREEYGNLLEEYPGDLDRLTAAGQTIALKEETYAMLLEQYGRTRIREALRANTISVVEPAVVPEEPATPILALNLALGELHNKKARQ